MARVYFSLGSNQGDRLKSLVAASRLIDSLIGKVIRYSPVVESEPWGFVSESAFYNIVLLVETQLNPHFVLASILEIEKSLGRIRAGHEYSNRIIDIDILFYEEIQIKEDKLIIPHPLLHLRRFILQPLAAIAPQFIHPVFQVTIAELLRQLKDSGNIVIVLEADKFAALVSMNDFS